MLSDTIPLLTDSTLIESVHLITNDTLVIKVQQVASSGGEKSSILDYVLKNGITILLALIAGIIALIQVKSNVISQARIKWMEDLRENLSELCELSMKTLICYINHKRTENEEQRDFYNNYVSSFSRFKIVSNKIYLLLNSKNPIHRQIEILIGNIDILIGGSHIDTTNQDDISAILNQIMKHSKQVFKEEWKRSKKVFKP
ncbi:hypothetical protein [Marinifilum fragile]|uniref:hypothetical protein n=1 Tax=Marinifilum fragile TaxID=570161 RepID=UPI002AA824EC|nr:hypothetical protein [Marinifilum fragile]